MKERCCLCDSYAEVTIVKGQDVDYPVCLICFQSTLPAELCRVIGHDWGRTRYYADTVGVVYYPYLVREEWAQHLCKRCLKLERVSIEEDES